MQYEKCINFTFIVAAVCENGEEMQTLDRDTSIVDVFVMSANGKLTTDGLIGDSSLVLLSHKDARNRTVTMTFNGNGNDVIMSISLFTKGASSIDVAVWDKQREQIDDLTYEVCI